MSDTQPKSDVLSKVTGGTVAGTSAAPTQHPPAAAGRDKGTGGVGATVWLNNDKINALWAINEDKNVWMSVAGVGWLKLANNSDTAIVALTILAANARHTQGNVKYRQEADNLIHEMCVW